MVGSRAQAPSADEGTHLVLYDGVCGLCNRVVQFLLRHDRRRVFRYASLQGAVGQSFVKQSGRDPAELTSFYVMANYRAPIARAFTRSDAVLFVAGQLDWPWKAALLMRGLPKAIRDFAYDVVSRSRYRVFGRYDHCVMPSPGSRSRFLD
jgi:predicted DCC family thiol-disulfide oxidoreductase YuxK